MAELGLPGLHRDYVGVPRPVAGYSLPATG